MPLPKPKKKESREEFVSRFMESEASKEFNNQKQGLAVAYQQYKDKEKKKK